MTFYYSIFVSFFKYSEIKINIELCCQKKKKNSCFTEIRNFYNSTILLLSQTLSCKKNWLGKVKNLGGTIKIVCSFYPSYKKYLLNFREKVMC